MGTRAEREQGVMPFPSPPSPPLSLIINSNILPTSPNKKKRDCERLGTRQYFLNRYLSRLCLQQGSHIWSVASGQNFTRPLPLMLHRPQVGALFNRQTWNFDVLKYLAPRIRGIKQKKSSRGSTMNNVFLLSHYDLLFCFIPLSLVACAKTSPSPQKKSGRETRSPTFSQGRGASVHSL